MEVVTGVEKGNGEETGYMSWWLLKGWRPFHQGGIALIEVLQPRLTAEVE